MLILIKKPIKNDLSYRNFNFWFTHVNVLPSGGRWTGNWSGYFRLVKLSNNLKNVYIANNFIRFAIILIYLLKYYRIILHRFWNRTNFLYHAPHPDCVDTSSNIRPRGFHSYSVVCLLGFPSGWIYRKEEKDDRKSGKN